MAATAAAKPKKAAPKGGQDEARLLVEARFPEREDFRRKVIFLFEDCGVPCFRVNYVQWRGESIESAFVRVREGKVEVAPEKPYRPLN